MLQFVLGFTTALAVAVVGGWLLWRHRSPSPSGGASREDRRFEELARLTGELAHEIKNPLSTVKVNLKLIAEQLEPHASDNFAEQLPVRTEEIARAVRKLSVVQKETDRLQGVLDGFLQYVRRPDLDLRRTDVNDLVGDMVDFYSPQAQRRGITLRQALSERPLMCRVDVTAIKQVLLNLFLNAQQAMEGGGELMVRTLRRGDRVVIQVSDTGIGIGPDKVETVFEPHYSSKPGGSGLGLPTARKLVEAHGGTIALHSDPGKGSCLTIELPLADEPGAKA